MKLSPITMIGLRKVKEGIIWEPSYKVRTKGVTKKKRNRCKKSENKGLIVYRKELVDNILCVSRYII